MITARERTYARSRRFRPSSDFAPVVPLGIFAALALSVATGIVSVGTPQFAVLPVAALVGALLLIDGRARLLMVIFGGTLFLQRSAGIDASKLALLGAFAIAFVGALLRIRKLRASAVYRLAAPLITASVIFAAMIILSMVGAHLRGTPASEILRDATPYLLFASTPVFALDAQSSFSRNALGRVLVAAGLFGAIAFAVVWLQRRGLAYLPLSRLGVASLFLPAALFSFAMSRALQANRRRLRWLTLAAVLLALLATTGTRTALALFVVPFAIVVATRRNRVVRSFRLALVVPLAISLAFVFAIAVVAFTHANTTFLKERISLVKVSGNSQADASYNDRLEEGHAAWSVFRLSPVFGVGPGYPFEYVPQGSQVPNVGFQLDTPLTFPAKFGIVGLLLAAFVAAKFWSFLGNVRRLMPDTSYLSLAGYFAFVLAMSFFAPPFEDKGFSYGLILSLALVLRSATGARAGADEPAVTWR
jgi:O-antigen ligase